MAIRIQEMSEPGATRSRGTGGSVLAESDAYRILKHELENYLSGRVGGRSFLIAGHRGAGKTTVVVGAIEQLRLELQGASHRPMLVMLHGPNLLPNRADERPAVSAERPATKENGESGEHESNDETGGRRKTDKSTDALSPLSMTQNALIQITRAMYRTFALEICTCFRDRVTRRAAGKNPVPTRVCEMLELATQLELELDDFPEPARLREIWRRARVLGTGVLFDSIGPGFRTGPEGAAQSLPPDQGLRELLALVSSNKAYERIEAQLDAKRTGKVEDKQNQTRGVELDSKGVNLVKPAISALAGALGGAAMLNRPDPDGFSAALVALAGVIGSSLVFKFSSSRSRDRSSTWEYSAVRDLSIATLDRVLPDLLLRIRAAGLSPIFVVDELDKVDNLSDRITELVRHLKKFVAENAFFCFLTDRSYYESMKRRELEHPYPIEYTYFTHQLFLTLSPSDLHAYLERILLPPDHDAPDTDTDDIPDHAVLPYFLLHEAQMHPIDLRRALVQLRNPDGTVNLRPTVVRTHLSYRCDLTIQLAIESLLEKPVLMRRLDRDPSFRRLVHDALYYPTRRWRSGKDVDLSDPELNAYFADRMKGDDPVPSKDGTNQAQSDGKARNKGKKVPAPRGEEEGDRKGMRAKEANDKGAIVTNDPVRLSDADRELLIQQIERLVELLSKPEEYANQLADYQAEREKRGPDRAIPAYVLDAVLREEASDEKTGLRPIRPLLTKTGPSTYRWRFDSFGRDLTARAERQMDWGSDRANIQAVERLLQRVSNGRIDFRALSNRLGFLSTTPAWTEAEHALDRLIRYQEGAKK